MQDLAANREREEGQRRQDPEKRILLGQFAPPDELEDHEQQDDADREGDDLNAINHRRPLSPHSEEAR